MTRNFTRLGLLCYPEDTEVVGKLISTSQGTIILEAVRRFEIPVEAPKSLRKALGKLVGVAVIDGKVRWRLVEAAPEPGKGERA